MLGTYIWKEMLLGTYIFGDGFKVVDFTLENGRTDYDFITLDYKSSA